MHAGDIFQDALGGVRAPEELWERVHQARPSQSPPRARKLVWAAAAAVLLAGVAWNLPRPEFRSGDAAAVRAWVRQRAGIDLPLAHSGPARIESVRLLRNGVELAYQSHGRRATISVSKGSAPGAHWSAGGVFYVLTCETPGDLDGSCGLCHI